MFENVSEVDIAYIAGLYEGEGSASARVVDAKHPDWSYRVSLTIGMTDREPLDRVEAIIGGVRNGPYRKNRRKPLFVWGIYKWREVEEFAAVVGPWLSRRRTAQLEAVLARATPLARRGVGGHNRAKTHCPAGHPYDEANTYYDPEGRRQCRVCRSVSYGRYLRNARNGRSITSVSLHKRWHVNRGIVNDDCEWCTGSSATI